MPPNFFYDQEDYLIEQSAGGTKLSDGIISAAINGATTLIER